MSLNKLVEGFGFRRVKGLGVRVEGFGLSRERDLGFR